MSQFLDTTATGIDNPTTATAIEIVDPTVPPLNPPAPEPVTDPGAAMDAAIDRIRFLWQEKRGSSAVWPWILGGVVIGLLINRR